ncbi:MAG: GntR family transcriptional regulator [Desulfobacterales bacterium]|nr:GntR family transcriptional regulator [Desulfobacterales bacterium]MDD4073540.1 GntR family transcriptional regulator [Desulfobacterales bacterium]MDD4394165.1 GntR family transcriptional regulator [Desulfobacterales bacterium]
MTKFKYSQTTEKAYEIIKKQLIEGKHVAGGKLDERSLSDELGTSRTPIREALNQLRQEGYIERVLRVGHVVKHFSLKEFKELYAVRTVLEVTAVRMALDHSDDEKIAALHSILESSHKSTQLPGQRRQYITDEGLEFHMLLNSYCGNETLYKYLSSVTEKITLIHRRLKEDSSGYDRSCDSLVEHRRIFEAFANRDADQLEKAVRDHNASAQQYDIDSLLRDGKSLI